MTPEDEEFNRIEREAAMRTEAVRATVTPRKWIGLTNKEIREFADEHLFYQPEGYEVSGIFNLSRAIEAKLREKNS